MNPKKITESILHVRENWKKSSNYFQNYLFIHLFVNNFFTIVIVQRQSSRDLWHVRYFLKFLSRWQVFEFLSKSHFFLWRYA